MSDTGQSNNQNAKQQHPQKGGTSTTESSSTTAHSKGVGETFTERAEAEISALSKLSKNNKILAYGVVTALVLVAVAWAAPKAWAAITVMANPEVAELRNTNVALKNATHELGKTVADLKEDLNEALANPP